MKKMYLIFVVAILALSACSSPPQSQTPNPIALRFAPKLSMFEEGTVHFEVGVANDSQEDFTGMKEANVQVVVTSESGEIRNQMWIGELSTIPGREAVYPLIYEAVYEIGLYVATFSGEDIPTLSVPFEIRDENGTIMLAASPEFIDPYTEFTLTEVKR